MNNEEVNNIRNEIKSYIAASGWTLTDVAYEMNKKNPDVNVTPQNISNKLTRGTIKYKEVKEIADIIGFEIKWTRK